MKQPGGGETAHLVAGFKGEKGREREGTERRESGGTLGMSIDNQRQRGSRVEGHGRSWREDT